jgi:hypothetical protein
MGNVLEVALQGREEFDIVLRLNVQLGKLAESIVELRKRRRLGKVKIHGWWLVMGACGRALGRAALESNPTLTQAP